MGGTSSSTRHLAEIVVTAAESSRNINKQISNIAQLRLSNMQLHGRDDDIKLLRRKLQELTEEKDGDEEDAVKNHVGEMILVSGTSGTGKSALIQKGLGDPAANRGYIFASGKFEDKPLRPLSAFSDAMTCLAKCIKVEHNKKGGLTSGGSSIAAMIRDKIQKEFDKEDVEQLRRVLPGCAELLGTRRTSLFCSPSQAQPDKTAFCRGGSGSRLGRLSLNLLGGKESISRMHYAVRRLLKIVCSHFKGVVLFIDDLQWSDTATLDLLKSIVLDGEIPSLLIVGAYREDEVPE
jgi:predicted ATPase